MRRLDQVEESPATPLPPGFPQGGEGRIRTGDTPIFSRVLYQSSYLARISSRSAGSWRGHPSGGRFGDGREARAARAQRSAAIGGRPTEASATRAPGRSGRPATVGAADPASPRPARSASPKRPASKASGQARAPERSAPNDAKRSRARRAESSAAAPSTELESFDQ
jgi:hypothetical protein